MSWCFYRILRDLYDFHDPNLTEDNYRDVLDRVEASGRDPDWAGEVLGHRCKIETFVTSLGNKPETPAPGLPPVRYMLDAHYLFCPGVATDLEPFFNGRTRKSDYHDALTAVLGDEIGDPDRLARKLHDWLDATVRGDVRFTNTFIPIEQRFVEPDGPETANALIRAEVGAPMDGDDVDTVARFVTWKALEWHHDNRKAFQIAVGAEYFICDGKSIPRFEASWTSEMARAFHRFGNARFDLMMASDVLAHEVAVLARQFPNVYVSGYWWHNFFPPTIEKNVATRLQVAPMTKFGGFLCDAYYAEWTYGKLQVVSRRRPRQALRPPRSRPASTRRRTSGRLLEQVLHDTPRDLYDLA